MKKGILILILLILALFSVSCIYAADVNDTLAASENTGEIELSHEIESADDNLGTIEEQTVTQTDSEEKTGETDDGTFTALRQKINASAEGSNVTLENDYYDDRSGEIIINKSITIDGRGHKIDANGQTRIFQILAGDVTIKNLTFINAHTIRDGGAIYWSGWGGVVSGCSFVNNSAYDEGSYSNNGGAIYWSGWGGVVSGCSFVNNTANTGCAISWKGDYAVVSGCSFVNNSIFKSHYEHLFTEYGGAIYLDGDYAAVSGCSFVNNSCLVGGAVALRVCVDATISGCSFVNNYADDEGGAVSFWTSSNNAVVSGCSFENNSAHGEGGAIAWRSSENGVVSGCSFVNNLASAWGGALSFWARSDNSTVSGCSFVNNSALNGDGGTICWEDSKNGIISGCSFVEDFRATGLIRFSRVTGNFSANNNIFSYRGTAILIWDGDFNLNADYNWFGTNASNYNAHPEETGISLNNWLFLNATADPSSLSISDSSDILFKLYLYNSTGISDYDNDKFQFVNLTLTATNGNLSKNISKLGESIRFTPTKGGTAVVTATVENFVQTVDIQVKGDFDMLQDLMNDESLSVISLERNYSYNELDTITDGIIINRTLSINGNGYTIDAKGKTRIFKILAENVTINNITFINANVTGDGGAILWNGGNGNVLDCSFAYNSAGYGGAIYWNSDEGNVSGCSFVYNSVSENGGAVVWSGNNGHVSDCSFTNNSASGNGGAVVWSGNNGHVSDCSFANNSVQNHGGAIYWDGAYGVLSGCSFEDNSAQRYGGAVVLSGSHGNVSGCSFEDNSAVYGGGLLWSASYGAVSTCSFVNNSADYGGAIRCSVYNGAVSTCSFEDNCADYGGAIYWGDIDLGTISCCIFMNNSANNGVVYRLNDNYGNNFRVNNNVFLANNCSAIALSKNDSAINADFNWFGHNASDYMDNPNLAGCNVWLFLNATADSSTLDLFGATDIAFRLYMYNSTSQNTSEYENTLLKQVTLAITSTKGNVNASVVGLGETVAYTATATGKGSVAAAVGNALYAVEFDILKGSSQLISKNLVTVYNANGYLVVTLKDAKGKAIGGAAITVSLNGVKTYTTDKNGQIKISAKGLAPKLYTAKVIFNGNTNFEKSTKDVKVTVKKATPKLTAKKKIFKRTVKTKKYTIVLKDNTGKAMKKVKVTLKIKGKKAITVKTNAKGKATFKIKKLTKKGSYKAVVKFKGNKYYNKATKKVTIKIK